MAYKSIATNATGSTSLVVPAPNGLVDGDILVIYATANAAAATFTWPAGFTAVTGSPRQVATPGGVTLGCALKVASSESGSYTITCGTACIGGLMVFSDRDQTVTPHRSSVASFTSAVASPWSLTSAAFSSATSVAGCDLIVLSTDDIVTATLGVYHIPPAAFTKRCELDTNTGNDTCTTATLDNVTIGHTGVLTGSGILLTKTAGGAMFALALAPRPTATVVARTNAALVSVDMGASQFPRALRQVFADTFTASNGTAVVGKVMDQGGVWLQSPLSAQSPTIQSNAMTCVVGGTYYHARTSWFDLQLGCTVRFTWVRQSGNITIRMVDSDEVQFLQAEFLSTSANVLTMYLWEYSTFSLYISIPNAAQVDLDATTPRLVEVTFGLTNVVVAIDGVVVQAASSVNYLPSAGNRRYIDVHFDQTAGAQVTTIDDFSIWTHDAVAPSDSDYGYSL